MWVSSAWNRMGWTKSCSRTFNGNTFDLAPLETVIGTNVVEALRLEFGGVGGELYEIGLF